MSRALSGIARVLLLGLGLLAGASSLSSAKPPSPDQIPDQKPLRHEVTVTLKLIQVFVSDRDGKPVRGLVREDFILRDGGEPRDVTEFEEHALTSAAVETTVTTTALPAPRLMGRKFLFFFDYAYNSGDGIRRAARIALDFLDTKLGPRDEVGVALFSGLKRLQIPLLFTGDVKKARDLVSRIGAFGSTGRVEELEDRYQRDLKEGGFADARPEDKLTWNLPTATGFNPEAEMRHLLRMYLDSLLALARALRYEPGQKNLVFFSYGAPYRSIWRGDQVSLDEKGRPPDQYAEVRNKAEALLKELATSNVAVYALNTSELSPIPENIRAGILGKMAQTTGGRYWGNVYEAAPFVDLVQSQTGSYYVLGYPVSERWDGRFHKIKVDVRKPGLKVRTQAGYFCPKAFADFDEEERRMQLVDLALSVSPLSQTPLRFPMAVVPVGRSGAGGLRLAASIPLDMVREAVGARVEISALAFNAADEIAAESRMEADLAPLPGVAAAVLADLAVVPGEYQCRIVVRSLETGRAAVAGATAKAPGANDTSLRVLPPLILRSERSMAALKPASKAKKPPVAVFPAPLYDLSQYLPHAGDVLHTGLEVLAEVRVDGTGGPGAQIRVGAFLFDHLNQVGIPVLTTVLAHRDEGSAASFLVRLSIPDVEPDIYALVFTAENEKSGVKVDFQRDFTIEKLPMSRRAGGGPR